MKFSFKVFLFCSRLTSTYMWALTSAESLWGIMSFPFLLSCEGRQPFAELGCFLNSLGTSSNAKMHILDVELMQEWAYFSNTKADRYPTDANLTMPVRERILDHSLQWFSKGISQAARLFLGMGNLDTTAALGSLQTQNIHNILNYREGNSLEGYQDKQNNCFSFLYH